METALIACLAILALFAVPPAQAFEQRQVGSWVLKWAQAQIGYYCTVETVQDGRTLAYQLIRDGRIFFGFKNPDWRWTPRSIHDVELSVPDEAEWTGKAVAPLPEVLVLPIKPGQALDPAKAMEAGKSLTFKADGTSIAFDLAGFAAAAKAQRDCLAGPT